MGNCLRQLVVLRGVVAKRRKFELLAASCLVPLSLGLSEPALAQTFTTAGNDYINGINVTTSGTVTLDPGVQVFVTPGNNVNRAVAFSTGGGPGSGLPATLIANNAAVTIDTTGNPAGSSLTSALFLHPVLGNATITASGIMNVAGGDNTNAIWAATFSSVPGAVASVTYTGAAAPGVIDINTTSVGTNSTVIQACANAGCGFDYTGSGITPQNGDAIINATGNLKGVFAGNSGFGLDAVAGGTGTATVNYHGGTIDVSGPLAVGIFVRGGSAMVTTDPGTTINVSSQFAPQPGVDVNAFSGPATATVASTIVINGPTRPISDPTPPESVPRAIRLYQLVL